MANLHPEYQCNPRLLWSVTLWNPSIRISIKLNAKHQRKVHYHSLKLGKLQKKTVRLDRITHLLWTALQLWQRSFQAYGQSGFGGGALEQKINFRLKWYKRVQMGPVDSEWSKKLRLAILIPFGPFGTLTGLPYLAIFGLEWTILGPSPIMKGGPQSKKGSSPGLLCVACF